MSKKNMLDVKQEGGRMHSRLQKLQVGEVLRLQGCVPAR